MLGIGLSQKTHVPQTTEAGYVALQCFCAVPVCFVATLWRACLRVTMYTQQASLLIHTYLNVYTLSSCRDAAERDLAAAEKAVKQLELAAPKAAQLAAAKREEAADLEARLGQLQVGTWAPQQQLNVRMIHDPVRQKCVSPSDK